MSDTKLGELIGPEAQRDAIHIAIAPVVAAERLKPGTHVGLNADGEATVFDVALIGIVDPFLKDSVRRGERFYLCLYQQTVTGMRHHWAHPSFKEVVAGESPESKAWITSWAAGKGLDYDEVIAAAEDYLRTGDCLNEGSRFEGEYVPDEFWLHYELATGRKAPESQRGSFFSCSC